MSTLIINTTNQKDLNLFVELAKRLKITVKLVKEEKSKKPNAETLKAIKAVEDGKTERVTLAEFRKQLYA